MARWVSLADRFPEAKHRIPNEDCRCPHCDHEFHMVSDWVHVRTGRKHEGSICARWHGTIGMWEEHLGTTSNGDAIVDFVVMPFVEWRALS